MGITFAVRRGLVYILMSDSCIALAGKGYVIMAADMNHGRSITVQLTDKDKIRELDSEKLMNCVELDPGDRDNFLEYVQKNMHLHEFVRARSCPLRRLLRGRAARWPSICARGRRFASICCWVDWMPRASRSCTILIIWRRVTRSTMDLRAIAATWRRRCSTDFGSQI